MKKRQVIPMTRWLMAIAAGAALCLAVPRMVLAQQGTDAQVDRPRIGLVLSGGGARGAAHVGVIRVLEELNIPVDYIAGTSMGSIIGGLYASGLSADEIEAALESMDWDDVFSDRPPRVERPFRRKRDDDLYLVTSRPGFNDGQLMFPSGAIQGQKFDLALRRLVKHVSAVSDFDALPIPFRAVASDIGTGKPVVLAGGDLAMAMRASMAVPGAFAATEIDGRLLVDGGITNNLPIDVARAMGADIVIAVDISTPLAPPENVRNMLQITGQLTSIMTRTNAELQIASLSEQDVLIIPELGDISSAAFDRAPEAIEVGRAAAEAKRRQLVRLSLPGRELQALVAERNPLPPAAQTVEFVRIVNNSRVADAVVREHIRQPIGEPLDLPGLEADIGRLYGLELFQTVHYDLVEDEEGRPGIEITANERSWGPNYLQFGVALSNDFRGDNRYNMAIGYLRTAINPLNGELRFGVQVGEDPILAANWYQPLDYAARYFVESRARTERRNVAVFEGSSDPFAEYRISQSEIELSGGRNFGLLAAARIGYRWGTGDVDVRVGAPDLEEFDYDSGSVFGRVLYDSLDNLSFPTSGGIVLAEYNVYRDGLGGDDDFEQLRSQVNRIRTFGAHTVGVGASFNTTTSGDAPIQNRFRMGGFLDLSGLPQDYVSGQHTALVQAIYYRRAPLIPYFQWYLGSSLELGNAWESRDDISVGSAILNGSIFLGLDTPLGPLYLGYGLSEGGQDAAFFYLGKTFGGL
jgi:NTE family protein